MYAVWKRNEELNLPLNGFFLTKDRRLIVSDDRERLARFFGTEGRLSPFEVVELMTMDVSEVERMYGE